MGVTYDKSKNRYYVRLMVNGVSYKYGTNPDTGSPFLTKREALSYESHFKAVALGVKPKQKEIKCSELFQPFFDMLSSRVKASTVYGRVKYFNKYLAPKFRGKVVTRLTNSDLEVMNRQLQKECPKKAAIGIVTGVARSWVTYLNAYNRSLDPNRFFKFVDSTPTQHEYRIWTREQCLRFLAAIDDPQDKLLFTILVEYGMRISEALALRYDDFDLVNDRVSVKRIVTVKTLAKRQTFTTPKSKNSVRTLKLVKSVKALLPENPTSEWLFPAKRIINGCVVLGQTSVARKNELYARKIGEEPLTLHEFRHSCASRLLQQGFSPRLVSRWLGNTEATVMNSYSHLFKNEIDLVGEWINDN